MRLSSKLSDVWRPTIRKNEGGWSDEERDFHGRWTSGNAGLAGGTVTEGVGKVHGSVQDKDVLTQLQSDPKMATHSHDVLNADGTRTRMFQVPGGVVHVHSYTDTEDVQHSVVTRLSGATLQYGGSIKVGGNEYKVDIGKNNAGFPKPVLSLVSSGAQPTAPTPPASGLQPAQPATSIATGQIPPGEHAGEFKTEQIKDEDIRKGDYIYIKNHGWLKVNDISERKGKDMFMFVKSTHEDGSPYGFWVRPTMSYMRAIGTPPPSGIAPPTPGAGKPTGTGKPAPKGKVSSVIGSFLSSVARPVGAGIKALGLQQAKGWSQEKHMSPGSTKNSIAYEIASRMTDVTPQECVACYQELAGSWGISSSLVQAARLLGQENTFFQISTASVGSLSQFPSNGKSPFTLEATPSGDGRYSVIAREAEGQKSLYSGLVVKDAGALNYNYSVSSIDHVAANSPQEAIDQVVSGKLSDGRSVGQHTSPTEPLSDMLKATSPEAESLVRAAMVSNFVQTWAGTSNNDSKISQAIQIAAAKLFDMPEKTYYKWRPNSATGKSAASGAEKHEAVLFSFLRAMYANTQEQFKADGITHVQLIRGMKSAPAWWKKGLASEGGNSVIESSKLRPISSYSGNPQTARGFGNRMTAGWFPVERVLGTCRSGFGCLGEYEYVVLAGDGKLAVRNWPSGSSWGYSSGPKDPGEWEKYIESVASADTGSGGTSKSWMPTLLKAQQSSSDATESSTVDGVDGISWDDLELDEDWIKTLSWDFWAPDFVNGDYKPVDDLAEFFSYVVCQPTVENVSHFMRLACARAMPSQLRGEITQWLSSRPQQPTE